MDKFPHSDMANLPNNNVGRPNKRARPPISDVAQLLKLSGPVVTLMTYLTSAHLWVGSPIRDAAQLLELSGPTTMTKSAP